MDALHLDPQRDFVARQYAHLVASGVGEPLARERLSEVMGAAALQTLDDDGGHGDGATPADEGIGPRMLHSAKALGGNIGDTQAALIHALAEARLFTLDWWRPIRTFLLYVLFLFGLAAFIAIIYAIFVLPSFRQLNDAMAIPSDAAGWILSDGAFRLLAPVVLMALALALLARLWWRMRARIAKLEPLAASRFGWLHGHAGAAYRTLLCLEYAAIWKAGGVADDAVLEPALQAAGGPAETADAIALREHLTQAQRLGTFAAELEWQRRRYWSIAQSELELARDRLILSSRVLFYILIGIMVTVLYLPIFTVASMFGVH